ncbi:hypothetical protein OPV22_029887 [Ensete ventricosum]|uniref:Uncharacterized protein n=1 Tax=Ensete ventricosum TaxID=4639 RepID=A0AAV8Q752_ENSVE|nr:hypothetical protein OPV22_029887 [Ensete ventricosum]
MALGRNKSDSQICYLVHLGAASAMEDLKAALTEHVDLTSELFEKFAAELRSGFGPAVDKYYVHAIDWKACPGGTCANMYSSTDKQQHLHRDFKCLQHLCGAVDDPVTNTCHAYQKFSFFWTHC